MTTGLPTLDDVAMHMTFDYEQFTEVLSAVACFVHPSPFISLPERVKLFLFRLSTMLARDLNRYL